MDLAAVLAVKYDLHTQISALVFYKTKIVFFIDYIYFTSIDLNNTIFE